VVVRVEGRGQGWNAQLLQSDAEHGCCQQWLGALAIKASVVERRVVHKQAASPTSQQSPYQLAKMDSEKQYLHFPSEEEYRRMSHDTLVQLIMHRDLTIRALRDDKAKQIRKASSAIVPAGSQPRDPNADWIVERCGKRLRASTGFAHLTPRGLHGACQHFLFRRLARV
jgi:hypothetical protein